VGHDVRFFESRRGAKIAYAMDGRGAPLVVIPPWATHLAGETKLSGFEAFHGVLAAHHTVIRYDRWGTGLSDRARKDFSIDADVEVLADLVDHLRLRRFALLGPSHAGLLAAVYAHQEHRRVSHLVLYGTRASALTRGDTWAAMRSLMLADWPVAAQAIAAVVARGSDPEDVDRFAEVFMMSASPEMMVALQDGSIDHDATGLLRGIRVPTLVLHRRNDALVSCDEAISLATQIPGARLELLEGEAHVYCVGDSRALAERVYAFTAGPGRVPAANLSAREAEVLELVAGGLTNAEVASRLVVSVRTVERHLLNAYNKLGVRGRTEAVSLWLRTNGTGTSASA
jgi:pimeloyl-ACP methyl ester carboxylesterase/DNA-binding CsgD family transcriptional regulator